MITPVGSFASSTETNTLAVDPTAEGDVFVVMVGLTLADDVAGAVEGITGGGVESWAPLAASSPAPDTGDAELWWGVIDTPGASTVTVATTVDTASIVGIGAQQFTAGDGYTWSIDRNAQSPSTDEAESGTYPPIAPAWVFELYLGMGIFLGGGTGGAESGFVYQDFASLLQFLYALNVSWPATLTPEWTAANGFWTACAGLLIATAPPVPLEAIYHQWQNADGTTPDGTVTFVLSSQTDGATEAATVGTRPIIAPLVNGQILCQLAPNVDDDLTPDGTYYWVTEDIVGSTPVSYPITVPDGGPFDLWTLRQQS